MNADERLELQNYANEHGRNWKMQLCQEWAAGSSVLRWARNTIGPSRLSLTGISPHPKSCDHDWVDDSHAGPNSGNIDMTCHKCGKTCYAKLY